MENLYLQLRIVDNNRQYEGPPRGILYAMRQPYGCIAYCRGSILG